MIGSCLLAGCLDDWLVGWSYLARWLDGWLVGKSPEFVVSLDIIRQMGWNPVSHVYTYTIVFTVKKYLFFEIFL